MPNTGHQLIPTPARQARCSFPDLRLQFLVLSGNASEEFSAVEKSDLRRRGRRGRFWTQPCPSVQGTGAAGTASAAVGSCRSRNIAGGRGGSRVWLQSVRVGAATADHAQRSAGCVGGVPDGASSFSCARIAEVRRRRADRETAGHDAGRGGCTGFIGGGA